MPSHERVVQGVWEVPVSSPSSRSTSSSSMATAVTAYSSGVATVTVRWGNEYARWIDKRLFFQLAVLPPSQLERARARHRARQEATQQRDAHRSHQHSRRFVTSPLSTVESVL